MSESILAAGCFVGLALVGLRISLAVGKGKFGRSRPDVSDSESDRSISSVTTFFASHPEVIDVVLRSYRKSRNKELDSELLRLHSVTTLFTSRREALDAILADYHKPRLKRASQSAKYFLIESARILGSLLRGICLMSWPRFWPDGKSLASLFPTWPRLWEGLGFLLPGKARAELYEPGQSDLLRDYLHTKKKYRSKWMKRWLCFCFTVRTVFLVADCWHHLLRSKVMRTLLGAVPEPLKRWWTN